MALHTYVPTNWKNAPDHKTTPVSANNLNNIENGIVNAYADIAVAATAEGTSYSNISSGLVATTTQDAVDEVNAKIPTWSSVVSCAIGATSATITDADIATTSVVEPFCSLSTPLAYTSITVTTGQAVIAFDALESAADFKVRITN